MFRINYDMLGISVSVICAIHCAVLPLVLTSLPVFGLNIINHSGFEYFMILIALGVGFNALWHGYKKHHRSLIPYFLFAAGIILLFAKQAWHAEAEILFLIPAVLLIIISHLINYKLSNKAGKTCKAPGCNHK